MMKERGIRDCEGMGEKGMRRERRKMVPHRAPSPGTLFSASVKFFSENDAENYNVFSRYEVT